MRNLLLLFIFILPVNSVSQKLKSQTLWGLCDDSDQINIFENIPSQPIDIKFVMGEHWQYPSDFGLGSFSEYYFYQDSTFKSRKGYSGGRFFENVLEGEYKIDNENNTIHLYRENDLYENIKIIGINDTILMIQVTTSENSDTMIYRRIPGCMKDQTWEYTEKHKNDWKKHHIVFRDFGQFVYTVTANCSWRREKEITFTGNYHLQNDKIYLKIRSKKNKDPELDINSSELFKPEKCACIRVNIQSKKINLSDFEKVINNKIDKKCWSYSNFEFKTERPLPNSARDKWIEISSKEN